MYFFKTLILSLFFMIFSTATYAQNTQKYMVDFVPIIINENGYELIIYVSSDYVKSTNNNGYRIPYGVNQAFELANAYDSTLPTTKIVDIIYQRSDLKLKPSPMNPTSQMSSLDYILRHNKTIEDQIAGRKFNLLAGHKKDVVLSNRGISNPNRVAIYGWHQLNGKPIQPLSTVHGKDYYDYSHGVRLVKRDCTLNNKPCDIVNILKDPKIAPLISYEGQIKNVERFILNFM